MGIIQLTANELFKVVDYLKSPEGIAGSLSNDSSFAVLDIPDSDESSQHAAKLNGDQEMAYKTSAEA